MFLDASAVIAILKSEPGFEGLLKLAIDSPTPLKYSPLSRFEAVVGLARGGANPHRSSTPEQIRDAETLVDKLFERLNVRCLDVTDAICTGAVTAAQTYGRCVGHPAALNLGDCFAYACAKEAKVGLLYKGGDFARTDIA